MTQREQPAPIVVTMGCPSGVGPEIALAGVREARRRGIDCRLIGDRGAMQRAAMLLGIEPEGLLASGDGAPAESIPLLETVAPLAPKERLAGKPTPAGGRAQLSWIDHAIDLTRHGEAAAMVTGPVSKEVIAGCGAEGAEIFTGHTEHIARRLGAGEPVMTFVAEGLTVSLVTTHLPLQRVTEAVTIEGVRHASVACAKLLVQMGKRPARVLVSALNPHAGEGGMLGLEEKTVITPAIEQARRSLREQGVDVTLEGPMPAEAAFRVAVQGAYDGVVAMYHDQATIPMKLLFFGRAVNVTAGLSIVRTSVDHGTAYDIAGQGKADPGSLIEAIALAARLAER